MNPDRRTLLGGAMLAGAVAGLSTAVKAQTAPATVEVLPLWPSTPPTFLCHAADDNGVPWANSIAFFSALKAAKVAT